ncbi:MAG: type II toxin-antitoxin system RelE/ParE family toxin [Dehalococcoidia bacterium]|nr:MAG: type II toxin-antitoxin system RelE/ParE family toxin [Dehalococcoidia bacterium]
MTTLAFKAALTKNFLREFKKLPEEVNERILTVIDEVVANPFLGIKLRGELEGRRRWRVGKYRIVYIIDRTPQLVVFLDVGLRKTIYK